MYRTRRLAQVIVLFVASLGWIAAAQADSASVKKQIEAANAEMTAALARGDAAGVAASYTADAQMLPPNSPTLSGRAAIQELWAGWIQAGWTKLTLTPVEVEGMGDTAYEVGTYVSSDGKMSDEGKYIVVWKKQQGKWRLFRDIWNTSLPAEQK